MTDKTGEDSQGNTQRSIGRLNTPHRWVADYHTAGTGFQSSKMSQVFVVHNLLPSVQAWKLKPHEIWVNEAGVSLTLDSDSSACAL